MAFVANQSERTIEASVAQSLGRAQARERGTHDDHTTQHGDGSLLDGDRTSRALPYGLVHLGAQILWWRLVQDMQLPVVADLEDL
jgi:hypothetical protein